MEGVRELNTRDTKTYIQKVLAGESPTFQSENWNRATAFETVGTQPAARRHRPRPLPQQTGFDLDAPSATT